MAALGECDLSWEEVRRRVGGAPPGHSDVLRQRFAAFLAPSAGVDDAATETEPGDARACGALVMRLGGAATTTVIAEWMGWTLERSAAAVAELDRRLDGCGLRVGADADGHLRVRERARLRARPRRVPFELLVGLDDAEHRHALAHLVRGENCPTMRTGGNRSLTWAPPSLAPFPACIPPNVWPPPSVVPGETSSRGRTASRCDRGGERHREAYLELDLDPRASSRPDAMLSAPSVPR